MYISKHTITVHSCCVLLHKPRRPVWFPTLTHTTTSHRHVLYHITHTLPSPYHNTYRPTTFYVHFKTTMSDPHHLSPLLSEDSRGSSVIQGYTTNMWENNKEEWTMSEHSWFTKIKIISLKQSLSVLHIMPCYFCHRDSQVSSVTLLCQISNTHISLSLSLTHTHTELNHLVQKVMW